MSRNRSKIISIIRKNKKAWNGKIGVRSINTRAVYKAYSPIKITPMDDKGFINYAKRSSHIQNATGISRQIKKTNQFIKKIIQDERKK